ncbi:hypothetical protein TorRG33x02_316250 [Trema orientale]|uniref:DUF247 domain protein n=1 Tax=Trema orientale TaxID=63057 RepID=A0A2P5BM08_TREOI|nr:hypothetical protein TorRG33x02_316250 [Trema orientale]
MKDSVTIEIPEVGNFSECKIFRVPRRLRSLNEKAFTPQIVSIGPFHHGKKELEGMESYKEKYCEKFLERTKTKKEELLSYTIKSKQSDKVKDTYAGTIKVINNFAEMILIDACFIFELFSRLDDENFKKDQDYILKTPWLLNTVAMDLILLENQLPFSFLKNLYGEATKESDNIKGDDCHDPKPRKVTEKKFHKSKFKSCFRNQSRDYNSDDLSKRGESSEPLINEGNKFLDLTVCFFHEVLGITADKDKEIEHFTDLVRLSWLPAERTESEQELSEEKEKIKRHNHLYSATKLDKAGLNFVLADSEKPVQPRLGDVRISSGPWYKYIPRCRSCKQLELSQLKIEDSTECLMRNVIALEHCLYPNHGYICDYIYLMNELIDTAEDVELLVKKKIVKNLLGSSQDAADLVNKLCDEMMQPKFIHSYLCKTLDDFYEGCWNNNMATIRRVYFKDLWTFSSSVVGLCVFILTIIVTIQQLSK